MRDRLRKDVIIKLVKKILSVSPAVKKVDNPISNGRVRRNRLVRAANCWHRRVAELGSGASHVTQYDHHFAG
jgi:hypothetical protein